MAQVGRHLGAAQIVGTVRRADQTETARQRGYDQVVLADDFTDDVAGGTGGLDPVDVIIDPVGGPLRRASLDALAPLGRLVCVGNASGTDDVTFGRNEVWMANAAVLGLNTGGLLAEHPATGRDPAQHALELLKAGTVSSDYTTLPLDQASQAHQRLEQDGNRQRLVSKSDRKRIVNRARHERSLAMTGGIDRVRTLLERKAAARLRKVER